MAAGFASFCTTTARGDENPLMRVVILPELIPDLAQQLVPIVVDLPVDISKAGSRRIEIAGLVYCGGDGERGAFALGTAYPEGAAPPSSALSSADCAAGMSDLARKLAASPD